MCNLSIPSIEHTFSHLFPDMNIQHIVIIIIMVVYSTNIPAAHETYQTKARANNTKLQTITPSLKTLQSIYLWACTANNSGLTQLGISAMHDLQPGFIEGSGTNK